MVGPIVRAVVADTAILPSTIGIEEMIEELMDREEEVQEALREEAAAASPIRLEMIILVEIRAAMTIADEIGTGLIRMAEEEGATILPTREATKTLRIWVVADMRITTVMESTRVADMSHLSLPQSLTLRTMEIEIQATMTLEGVISSNSSRIILLVLIGPSSISKTLHMDMDLFHKTVSVDTPPINSSNINPMDIIVQFVSRLSRRLRMLKLLSRICCQCCLEVVEHLSKHPSPLQTIKMDTAIKAMEEEVGINKEQRSKKACMSTSTPFSPTKKPNK